MIALYHFITFITLLHLSLYRFYRIYHLITFLMKKPSLLTVIIGTAANRLEVSWGEDPSRVVVDEMVGVWIALLAAPAGHVWYALGAFVLFRLFDIFKPLGIRRMESLPGGIGVMMDDILSGVYGFIILIVARWIIS